MPEKKKKKKKLQDHHRRRPPPPPPCDVSMTNPTVTSCSSASNDGTTTMKVAYDQVQVDCGDAIALTTASNTVPVIHVAEESNSINADAYYSLLLVDTSNSMVHPILHYGAVNIPGAMLLDAEGLALMEEAIVDQGGSIFSDYRPPSPPSPTDPWATPNIEQQLFAYEF